MTWTLTELAELAARALADAGVGVANGRVTGMPDARMVRWYTTIGLLDRPTFSGGRVARYGPRHLWQLVAIKRLQAQGLTLAEIQVRLAGATDEHLRRMAALPEGLLSGVGQSRALSPSRPTLSGHAPESPELTVSRQTVLEGAADDAVERRGAGASDARSGADTARAGSAVTESRRGRFWGARQKVDISPAPPGVLGPDRPHGSEVAAPLAGADNLEPAGNLEPADSSENVRLRTAAEHRLFGLRLGGMTLLLDAEPAPDDWEAIAAAARPLLSVLAERGLLDPTEGVRP